MSLRIVRTCQHLLLTQPQHEGKYVVQAAACRLACALNVVGIGHAVSTCLLADSTQIVTAPHNSAHEQSC